MFNLFSFLDRLLAIIAKWAAHREHQKAQKERDELLESPADWFTNHFNGMPTDSDKNKTDKTDTTN